MLKKIKDIYQVQNLKGNDPLILWHNKVIDKFPYDLTIADVARCIRQNLFIDTVYEVLLSYLMQDLYIGDLYNGELMEKASEVERSVIISHEKIIKQILFKAREFINDYNWDDFEDKKEFENSVNQLEKIIKNG